MNDLSSLTQRVGGHFCEMLQLVLRDPAHLDALSGETTAAQDLKFFAVVPLTGAQHEGAIALESERGFLEETHPERKYGAHLSEADLLDWAHELLHRVIGGSRARLKEDGWNFTLGQPTASRSPLLPQALPTDQGNGVMISSGKFKCLLRVQLHPKTKESHKVS